MDSIVQELEADGVVAGTGRGDALILSEPLSLWGGLDPSTGEIIDRRHPNCGQNVAGRVLLIPGSRGSSSASSILLEAVRTGCAPVAIITRERDGILALGSAVAQELYGNAPPMVVLDDMNYRKITDSDMIEVIYQDDVALCRIMR